MCFWNPFLVYYSVTVTDYIKLYENFITKNTLCNCVNTERQYHKYKDTTFISISVEVFRVFRSKFLVIYYNLYSK